MIPKIVRRKIGKEGRKKMRARCFEQGRVKAIVSVNAGRTLDSCCGLNMTAAAAALKMSIYFVRVATSRR